MNVMQFMIPKSLVTYATSDSTVRQVLEKMRFHRYAAIPILAPSGKYLGTLKTEDLFGYFLNNGSFDSRSAEKDGVLKILDSDYSKPVYHNASMNELIEKVKEHNFVPVVDDRGCFIGIVLRRDVLNFLLKYYEEKNDSTGGKT